MRITHSIPTNLMTISNRPSCVVVPRHMLGVPAVKNVHCDENREELYAFENNNGTANLGAKKLVGSQNRRLLFLKVHTYLHEFTSKYSLARRFGNNKKYLSLKYTISYMKTYILASVIPSRISAKLYYLHIINTYVRHYKNSSAGGTLNCSPVHICCYRITIVWMSDIICILFTCL